MDYNKFVIKPGDKISKALSELFSETLQNHPDIEIIKPGMNGIVAIKPESNLYVAHTASGNPEETDTRNYINSLVEKLIAQAEVLDAEPVAISNIIDSSHNDINIIVGNIAQNLKQLADRYGFAVINGEYAICNTVNPDIEGNVSATMISKLNSTEHPDILPELTTETSSNKETFEAIFFNPQDMYIYLNSDGTGTKPNNFYTRAKKYSFALRDSVAMKVDDSIKIGAIPIAIMDLLETNLLTQSIMYLLETNPEFLKNYPIDYIKSQLPKQIHEEISRLQQELGPDFIYSLQVEDIQNRLIPYKSGEITLNVTGTAINLIDLERLNNPPTPQPGDYLLYIVGEPNGRSNGWTSKNEIMLEFGKQLSRQYRISPEDWHKTPEGKAFLEYLSRPSTILYPLYAQLLNKGLATSFYHMSGGAYNGKLARPLSQHNLYAFIKDLPDPPWVEKALMGMAGMSIKDAYGQWPLGVDGFITTNQPDKALEYIRSQGYDAGVVSQLQKAKSRKGIGIKTPFGKTIYFHGGD